MHLLYKRIRNLNLPTDLQLQLFEHTILPIALYGCEIWVYENTDIIEKLQNNSLGISQIQGNLLQLICCIQTLDSRLLMLKSKPKWLNIVNSKETKLSKLLYKFLLCEYNSGIYQHKWIHCIKEILISVGRVDLLHKEVIENPKLIKMQIS